jgi:hypothetical protein
MPGACTPSMPVPGWCYAVLTVGEEALRLTRPEHPCMCASQAAGPDPVRSVDGRTG